MVSGFSNPRERAVIHEDDNDVASDDHLAQFSPVVAGMNLERLPQFALSIRKRYGQSDKRVASNRKDPPLTCTVISPPFAGSYNILFPIQFSDGVRWLFKIPATGYRGRFDGLASETLRSEAMTMRLVKSGTSIPVPEVYKFSASLNNEMNCPYILMEHLQGRPLYELWFQKGSSDAALRQFRTRVLQELAAATVQLNSFRYPQGGSLVFDPSGDVTGIGPIRAVDLNAQADRLANDDYDDSAIFCTKGPFNDAKSFLTFAIDRQAPSQDPAQKYHTGVLQLLRLLIDWLPLDNHSAENAQFVLAHPDLNFQNILVSEEGAILGVIDWDGAGAVPACIAHYPLWLMHDWDPLWYGYDFEEGSLVDEDLAFWRSIYAQSMEDSISDCGSNGPTNSNQGKSNDAKSSKQPSEITMLRSPLFWSLALAAENPMCLHENMRQIFNKMKRLTAPEWDKGYPDQASHSLARRVGYACCVMPIYRGMRECLDYVAQFLHNKGSKNSSKEDSYDNSDISAEIDRPLGEDDHAQNAGSIPPHAFYGTTVDGKKMEPQQAIVEPVVVQDSQSTNKKTRVRRIKNALNAGMKKLHKKAKKVVDNDTEHEKTTVEACGNSGAKSLRGRFRKTLSSPLDLLQKKKTRVSDQDLVSAPAVVEESINAEGKRQRSQVRDTIKSALPCLGKRESGVNEMQDDPGQGKDEENDFTYGSIPDWTDTDCAPGTTQKRHPSLKAAVKTFVHNLQEHLTMMNENRLIPLTFTSGRIATPETEKIEKRYCPSSVFMQWSVTDALVDDTLTDGMAQRLKEGFDALVATAI